MAGQYDLGYKLLFAHPELVRELLAGFTPFASLGAAELPCFERVNPSYVSEVLSERVDDIVWRVRLGEQWIYVYILIEFQATVDRWMALRMQVYVGLLYQDLIKPHGTLAQGMLPPVLPLVFYHGAPAWSAHRELRDLISTPPDGLHVFQPSQSYFLIEQRLLDPVRLARHRGVLSQLFRLELSEQPEVLLDVIPMLVAWLSQDGQESLRRDVTEWIHRLIRRESAGDRLLETVILEGSNEMGPRKFATWEDAVLDRGVQKGLAIAAEPFAKLLFDRLTSRFGPLSDEVKARIDEATFDDLVRWAERAPIATTPEDATALDGAPESTPPTKSAT